MKIMLLLFCIFFCAEVQAKQHSHIHTVVFDFGGVIARADTDVMKNFLKNSFKIDEDKLSSAFAKMQEYIMEGGTEKQFWECYALQKNISLSPDWFEQFDAIIQHAIVAIPETLLIVKELQQHNYQTALHSDMTQYQAEVIRRMGFFDLFNPTILSYEIGVTKTDSEAFKILLQKLQLPAAHIIFIDDRSVNIETAKTLGIDSIQFISPEQLKKEFLARGLFLNTSA